MCLYNWNAVEIQRSFCLTPCLGTGKAVEMQGVPEWTQKQTWEGKANMNQVAIFNQEEKDHLLDI